MSSSIFVVCMSYISEMSDEEIAAAVMILFDDDYETERDVKERRYWVGPICESRENHGMKQYIHT